MISKADYSSKKIFAVFLRVMGLTCLIKLVKFFIFNIIYGTFYGTYKHITRVSEKNMPLLFL